MGLGEGWRKTCGDTARMSQTNHANMGFGSRLERFLSEFVREKSTEQTGNIVKFDPVRFSDRFTSEFSSMDIDST